jgi:hypothetical protein
VLPFNVKLLAQTVLLLPALETVGKSSRVTCTVEAEEGQIPLLIDHWKMLAPTPKLFITAVLTAALFRFAEPLSTVQLPVPTDGALPFNVNEVAQMVVLFPAFACEGGASLVMLTVDIDAAHTPLVIDHCRMLSPTPRLLTGVVFNDWLVIVAVPLSTDQLPDPTEGAFPFNVKLVAQTVPLLPAFETVGKLSRVICIVEVEEGHTPLLIVHPRT